MIRRTCHLPAGPRPWYARSAATTLLLILSLLLAACGGSASTTVTTSSATSAAPSSSTSSAAATKASSAATSSSATSASPSASASGSASSSAASGSASGSTSAAAGGKLIIGWSGPTTGDAAVFGIPYLNGIKMATDEWNAKGGVGGKQVELVVLDDACDPKQASNTAAKLIDTPGLVAAFAHMCSGTTMVGAPLFFKAGIPEITISSNPKITQQGWTNLIRPQPNDNIQGAVMAQVMVQNLGIKKWAVYNDKQAFGQGVSEVFANKVKELGGTVTSTGGVDPKDTDFSPVLTTVATTNPDGFYFGTNFPTAAGLIVKQARQLGYKWQFAGPDGTFDPAMVKAAGNDAIEGFVSSFQVPPYDSTQKLKDFSAAYNKKYGKDPEGYAVYGYDVANMLYSVIQKVGTDKPAIIKALHEGGYKGIMSDDYKFDANGDMLEAPLYLYTVHTGKFDLLANFANGKTEIVGKIQRAP